MGFLRIYCDYCKQNYEVYRHQINDDKANRCPHCLQKIDNQTWKQIQRAWGEMEDSNMELMKDHTGYHKPIFTVSYIPDHIFRGVSQDEEY